MPTMDDEMFNGVSNWLRGEGLGNFEYWQYLPRDIQGEICELLDPDTKRTLRTVSKGTRDAVDNGVRRLLIHDARVIETINAIDRFTSLREIRFLQKELLILSDLPAQLTHVDARLCEEISVNALCTLLKRPWISLSVSRATVSMKEFGDLSKASLNDDAPSGYFRTKDGVEFSNREAARLTVFKGLMALSSRDRKINADDVLSFAKIRGLKELTLGREWLPQQCNDVNYTCMTALLGNASLTSLDVSDTKISEKDDATVFFNALAANTSLRHLRMDNIHVGRSADDRIDDDIACCLSRNTTLVSLSVESNYFSDAGMKCLASMQALTDLNVSRGVVSEVGLRSLLDNTNLKRLRLDFNTVSSELIKAFVGKGTLTSLSLRGCDLNEEALEHLWRSQSLLELDIGSNFSREELRKIPAHPTLRLFSVGHSPTLRVIDVMALRKNGLISDRTTLDFDYAQVDAVLNSEELQAIAGAGNFPYIDDMRISGTGFAGGNLRLLPPELETLHLISLGKLVENDLQPLLRQSKLKQIKVVGTEVDDAGLALLASLKSLQHLEFSDVLISARGRAVLEAHRGQADVSIIAPYSFWQGFQDKVNDFLGA